MRNRRESLPVREIRLLTDRTVRDNQGRVIQVTVEVPRDGNENLLEVDCVLRDGRMQFDMIRMPNAHEIENTYRLELTPVETRTVTARARSAFDRLEPSGESREASHRIAMPNPPSGKRRRPAASSRRERTAEERRRIEQRLRDDFESTPLGQFGLRESARKAGF